MMRSGDRLVRARLACVIWALVTILMLMTISIGVHFLEWHR